MKKILYGPPAEALAALLDDPDEHDFAAAERIVRGLSAELALTELESWPHSVAEILAHMNSNVQFNLGLIRSENPEQYKNPYQNWPEVRAENWDELVEEFLQGLGALKASGLERVLNPPTENEPGWTVGYKLALSVARHNAYRLGQIALLRKILGTWPG